MKMSLSQARKAFKDIGYKLKVQTLHWPESRRHAKIINRNGQEMPMMFHDSKHREEWLPAINLKGSIAVQDKGEKIYGFSC